MLKSFLSNSQSSHQTILEDFTSLVAKKFIGVSICSSVYNMTEERYCLYFDKHASNDSGHFDRFIEKYFKEVKFNDKKLTSKSGKVYRCYEFSVSKIQLDAITEELNRLPSYSNVYSF